MRWPRWIRRRLSNGERRAAQRAAGEAERRLREAHRDWPDVRQTHDQLAKWMDDALHGRA